MRLDLGFRIDQHLRLQDLAVGTESPLEGGVIGGPSETADEASVLDIRSRHGEGIEPDQNPRPKRGRRSQPTPLRARENQERPTVHI